jgi:CheY-like chemotaxis protein
MFQKEFEVLVVDDDPDVLAVTRLAMRGIKVYGIPLKVRTCASLAEAIDLFNTKADLLPALAVALIDVVMETDTAGLDLCRYVREERKNQLTQLFIRTGQPARRRNVL